MKALPKRHTVALFCLLFFFLFPGFMFAQAWNPFPGSGSYLYTFTPQNLSDTWLHGTRVDSTGLAGGDSVYFFNRINRYAEQTEILNGCNGPISASGNVILMDQDNYFGREMILQSNGDYDFVSSAGDTFRLKTQLSPGNSWTFSTGITATLDSISSQLVLGVTDSVMYISLSNSHSIELSKDHGFVNSFSFLPFVSQIQTWETVDFSLWGIPAMGLGDTLPGARGVLDFDIGDRFGSKREDSYNSAANTDETYSNTVITGKTSTANGVSYTSDRDTLIVLRASMQPNDSTYFPPVSYTETFNYADYDFLNLLPYESTPARLPGDLVQVGVNFRGYYNERIEYRFEHIIYYDSCVPALTRFEEWSQIYYIDGLGSTHDGTGGPGVSNTQWLLCYQKATDSLAPCFNLGTLIGVEERLGENLKMTLGPVPARDQLQIKIENYHRLEALELTVVDLQGRIVGHSTIARGESSSILDVRALKAGMYALQIRDKNGRLGWKKFVVMD